MLEQNEMNKVWSIFGERERERERMLFDLNRTKERKERRSRKLRDSRCSRHRRNFFFNPVWVLARILDRKNPPENVCGGAISVCLERTL